MLQYCLHCVLVLFEKHGGNELHDTFIVNNESNMLLGETPNISIYSLYIYV